LPPRRVGLPDEVRETIARLDPGTKRTVRATIDAIAEDPTIGQPLEQELAGFRKVAIGAWRVVYREERRTIVVRAVGRRATVYSDLIDRLRRSLRERPRPYRRGTRAPKKRRSPAAGRVSDGFAR